MKPAYHAIFGKKRKAYSKARFLRSKARWHKRIDKMRARLLSVQEGEHDSD